MQSGSLFRRHPPAVLSKIPIPDLRSLDRERGSVRRWRRFLILSSLLLILLFALVHTAAAAVLVDGDVALAVKGPTEPYTATLSGGASHFLGYRESRNGEGVRFRRVPEGSYLLRIETRCGSMIERVVDVPPSSASSKVIKVEIRMEDAVVPHDWKGGHLTTSVRDLSWPRSTQEALTDAWKHMERGEFTTARACLRRAVTSSPDCVDAWTNLGLVAEWDQSLEEAERFHRQAFRLDQDSFATNLNLSELLERLGKTEEAIEFGVRALAIRPRDLGANLHAGTMYAHVHQFSKAVTPLMTAKEIHPQSLGMLQLLLAVALVETGSPEEAVVEFDEWLRRFPEHPSRQLILDTRREIAEVAARLAD